MRRLPFPLLLLIAAALGLVVPACGNSVTDKPLGSDPAATVNGVEISQDELLAEADLRAQADAVLSGASSTTAPPASYDAATLAQVLNDQIITILLEQELDKRDIEVTAEHEATAQQQLAQQFAQQDPTSGQPIPGSGEEQLAQIPEALAKEALNATASSLALMEVLAPVSDADIEKAYEENKEFLATPCVSHILIGTDTHTPEEALQIANDLKSQIDAGADFAQVATENSEDPGSAPQGGELGCNPAGSFVPEFEQAVFTQPVGEVGDPVQSEFGYHLILVTEREVPTLETSRDQIEAALAQSGQQALQEWLTKAMTDAEVEVDPRYGTWDPEGGGVVPPEGPAAPSTTAGSIPGLDELPTGELPLETVPAGE